jgi:NADH-quinone oxidoreductase subunit A
MAIYPISEYAYIGLFLLFGIAFVLVAFLFSWVLRPNRPNPLKTSTYECGEKPIGSSWVQFNVRFYIIALIFLIFDVEAVFIIPWAIIFRSLGLFAYLEMMLFIVILAVGLFYAWKKGMLKWL